MEEASTLPPSGAQVGSSRIHAHQRSNICQDVPEETVQQRTKEKAMSMDPTSRPPLPPFTCATATQKVRLAEDAWNSRDPARVALAYTLDSTWRNRSEFLVGREAIVQFLQRKWATLNL